MKYCRRCKFLNSFGLCSEAGNVAVNIVTGMPFNSAQDPEKMRISSAYCGVKAVWFEDKTPEKRVCGTCRHAGGL